MKLQSNFVYLGMLVLLKYVLLLGSLGILFIDFLEITPTYNIFYNDCDDSADWVVKVSVVLVPADTHYRISDYKFFFLLVLFFLYLYYNFGTQRGVKKTVDSIVSKSYNLGKLQEIVSSKNFCVCGLPAI